MRFRGERGIRQNFRCYLTADLVDILNACERLTLTAATL